MKKLSILLLGLLVFCVGNAFAFPLWPGVGTNAGTLFEDQDLDYFVDRDGDNLITVGDVLISAVEFPFVKPLPSGAPYPNNTAADELVAFATIKLMSIDASGLWIFGQDGTTPMVQFFTGGTNLDLDSDPTQTAATFAATDGTPLWSFSIDPLDGDNFWVFSPFSPLANNPNVVANELQTTKIGAINYALNFVPGSGIDIFNNIALGGVGNAFAAIAGIGIKDGLVEMTGSGDILGAQGLLGGAFATSDIDAAINPTVIPEPATLSLFGLSLIGLAFVSRRRSRR